MKFEFAKPQLFFGTDGIKVDLVSYTERPYRGMAIKLGATWGDLDIGITEEDAEIKIFNALKQKRFLGQVLEVPQFTFAISGVTRACTHQIVRTRIGAGFGQQGGRDNDFRTFSFRFPETMVDQKEDIERLIDSQRKVYSELVDSGVPYQDARFVLPIGMMTNIVGTYNFMSLVNLIGKRMINVMQWEINFVAREMKKRVEEVHPVLGEYLMPMCERVGRCVSNPTLFITCGKFPVPDHLLDKTFPHSSSMNPNMKYVESDRIRYKKKELNNE